MADETAENIGSAAAAVTVAASTIAVNNALETQTAQNIANAWLDKLQSTGGYVAHVAASLAVAVLQNTLNPLVMQANTEWTYWLKQRVTPSSFQKTWDWTNKYLALFLQPSISGIPIICQEENSERQVDVSEEPLIVQQAFDSTQYVTDNAVPRPREWTLQGYLMAFEPLDAGLINKPFLNLLRATLDLYTKSRRPVLFKTYDLTFKKVLITRYSWKYAANVMNGIEVSISLKEYCPAKTMLGSTSSIMAELVGVS